MAKDPIGTKFPPPLPNPLRAPVIHETNEELTDPNLVIPEQFRTPPILPTPSIRAAGRMPDLGSLDIFMQDPTISEIIVNDLRNIIVEKEGKLLNAGFAIPNIEELNRITRNILDVTGKILTPDQPYIDTMLSNGSRVNIISTPLTLQGPCLTIRKFPTKNFTAEDLIASDMWNQNISQFLNACVVGKINVLICGGTGSGKTTLLNVLSTFIPKNERIITIEDTPELSLQLFNSVRLQTKPQTPTSAAITARDLVANSLRMRPDRIIVGECRRSEAFDMLQAMNTGHSGSMTTIHANSSRDGLARLETLSMMAGAEIPLLVLRRQIASAIDLIVQIQRFRNGKRRVIAVTEVTGMESEIITLQDIFIYKNEITPGGLPESGRFQATGLVPTFIDRLREEGVEIPRSFFGN